MVVAKNYRYKIEGQKAGKRRVVVYGRSGVVCEGRCVCGEGMVVVIVNVQSCVEMVYSKRKRRWQRNVVE